MKIVLGLGMVSMSTIIIFGGITGRLAPMLAALFVPDRLVKA